MQFDKEAAAEALRNNPFEPMVAVKLFGRTAIVTAEQFDAITHGEAEALPLL